MRELAAVVVTVPLRLSATAGRAEAAEQARHHPPFHLLLALRRTAGAPLASRRSSAPAAAQGARPSPRAGPWSRPSNRRSGRLIDAPSHGGGARTCPQIAGHG